MVIRNKWRDLCSCTGPTLNVLQNAWGEQMEIADYTLAKLKAGRGSMYVCVRGDDQSGYW